MSATGLNIASRVGASRMLLRGGARSAGLKMVDLVEEGEFGTTDYSMTFKVDGEVVSPWHDMPLELEGGLYNMLTEIPKMTFKKMEVRAPHAAAHAATELARRPCRARASRPHATRGRRRVDG